MDVLAQAITNIIAEQEKIIGPIAREQAQKVNGLTVDANSVKMSGDEKVILEALVKQYQLLFGRASIEVCKDALKPYSNKINPKDLPDILK